MLGSHRAGQAVNSGAYGPLCLALDRAADGSGQNPLADRPGPPNALEGADCGACPGQPRRPQEPAACVNAKLSAKVAAQIQGECEQSDLLFEAMRRLLPARR